MTKKDAAQRVLLAALELQAAKTDPAVWIDYLLWIAEGLDPAIIQDKSYVRCALGGPESRLVKLRRLIEHPATPTAEREAAVLALARIRENQA